MEYRMLSMKSRQLNILRYIILNTCRTLRSRPVLRVRSIPFLSIISPLPMVVIRHLTCHCKDLRRTMVLLFKDAWRKWEELAGRGETVCWILRGVLNNSSNNMIFPGITLIPVLSLRQCTCLAHLPVWDNTFCTLSFRY